MRCKKCGKRIKRGELFCTVCGYYNGEVENNDWDTNFQEVTTDEFKETKKEEKPKQEDFSYEHEDLLEAYIGEDYKIIKKWPFNVYAFFLNFIYLLYRKLYITGTIGLIITAIVITKFSGILIPYIIIMMLLLGFGFNYYYVFICKKKIEEIMRDYDGSDKFSLLNICEEKGGVNILFALLIYLAFILIVFFSFARININRENTKFWQENSENQATCISLVKISYGELETYKIPGTAKEGVCKISKDNFTEYEVYIKTEKNGKEYYSYFQTEGEGLLYKDNTSRITFLEKKRQKDTITNDEQSELNSLKQMKANYEDIKSQSKTEDNLIKTKKNKSEKLNYVFTQEEIIR